MPNAGEAGFARSSRPKTPNAARTTKSSKKSPRSKIPVRSVKKSVKLNKARPLPDFKKLHQNWSDKFERGKAYVKKPCTVSEEFQLTRSAQKVPLPTCTTPSKESYSPDKYAGGFDDDDVDFIADQKALDSIVTGVRPARHEAKDNIQHGFSISPTPVRRKVLADLRSEFNKPLDERSPRSPLIGKEEFKADAKSLKSILDNVGISDEFATSTPQTRQTLATLFKTPVIPATLATTQNARSSIYYKGPQSQAVARNHAYTDFRSMAMSASRFTLDGNYKIKPHTASPLLREPPRKSIYKNYGPPKSTLQHENGMRPKTPKTASRVRLAPKSPALRSPAVQNSASCLGIRWKDVLKENVDPSGPLDKEKRRLTFDEKEEDCGDGTPVSLAKPTSAPTGPIKMVLLSPENQLAPHAHQEPEGTTGTREFAIQKYREIEAMERQLENEIASMEIGRVKPKTPPVSNCGSSLRPPSAHHGQHVSPLAHDCGQSQYAWTDKGSPVRPASISPPQSTVGRDHVRNLAFDGKQGVLEQHRRGQNAISSQNIVTPAPAPVDRGSQALVPSNVISNQPQSHQDNDSSHIMMQMRDVEQQIMDNSFHISAEQSKPHSAQQQQNSEILEHMARLSRAVEQLVAQQSGHTPAGGPSTHILHHMKDISSKMESMITMQNNQQLTNANTPPRTDSSSIPTSNNTTKQHSFDSLRQQANDILISDKSSPQVDGQQCNKSVNASAALSQTVTTTVFQTPKMTAVSENHCSADKMAQGGPSPDPSQARFTPVQCEAAPQPLMTTPIQNNPADIPTAGVIASLSPSPVQTSMALTRALMTPIPFVMTPTTSATTPTQVIPPVRHISPTPQLLTPISVYPLRVSNTGSPITCHTKHSLQSPYNKNIAELVEDLKKKCDMSVQEAIKARFQDVLIDEECAIYACRQVTQFTPDGSRCRDPVAHSLTIGDDKHVIPIREHVPRVVSSGTFTAYVGDS